MPFRLTSLLLKVVSVHSRMFNDMLMSSYRVICSFRLPSTYQMFLALFLRWCVRPAAAFLSDIPCISVIGSLEHHSISPFELGRNPEFTGFGTRFGFDIFTVAFILRFIPDFLGP